MRIKNQFLVGACFLFAFGLSAQTITNQPMSQVVVSGSTATLSVGISGSQISAYQWQYDGTNLDGQNGVSVTLVNMNAGQSGNYAVVVSNSFEVVTSQVARVTAINVTKTWTGSGDGVSWTDPNNWSGGSLPTSADSIFIGYGTNTISGFPLETLNSMVCQSPIAVNYSLTVTGAVQIAQGTYGAGVTTTASGTDATLIDLGVTGINSVSMTAQNGALESLPALTNFASGGYRSSCTLEATGSNSVLDLPALTTINGPNYASTFLNLNALEGGELNLPNVTAMYCAYNNPGGDGNPDGIVISATGTNSVIDLSGLQVFSGMAGSGNPGAAASGSQMQPSNGGQILVPNLAYAMGVSLYVAGGMTFSLPALTNFVSEGYRSSCTLQAAGSNSVLDLPALATINGPNYASTFLNLNALEGGELNLPSVTAMYCAYNNPGGDGNPDGIVISSAGTNSVVYLSGLQVFSGMAGSAANGSQMQASGGGQIFVNSLSRVTGTQVLASGANSVLNCSGDPYLTIGSGVSFGAESGGLLEFSGMQSILANDTAFLADGAGSVIDLPTLSGFTSPAGTSSLTAQNGGAILVNCGPILLQNVAWNWAGNCVLPPVIAANTSLQLFAPPWDSYRINVLDASKQASQWGFYARIPATTSVMTITGSKPSGSGIDPRTGIAWSSEAFEVADFVAEMPILDLNWGTRTNAELVLYGTPSESFEVQTTTNLSPGSVVWVPLAATGGMTNSFRIFPAFSPTDPERFFRVEEQ